MFVLNKLVFLVALSAWFTSVSSTSLDYYKLLGIERSSDNRAIRKAFKRLALTLHPDKNPDNEKAHEDFLAINRAYEVLKDEDLRRVYDEFGDAGLKQQESGRPPHQRYQSWTYYNEVFGIYDNDDEIITLSRSDFEHSVKNQRRESIWFINFYSPRCSHCHTLAPEWRKLAKELANVIRIGAVNCGEDRELCQNEQIFSYPSLYLYPQKIKFDASSAPRDAENLVRFVMKNLNVKVRRYNHDNSKRLFVDLENSVKSQQTVWRLLSVCFERQECLTDAKLSMLTYKLDGITQVAEILCTNDKNTICEEFRLQESKLVLYKDLANSPDSYFEVGKADSELSDIFSKVIAQLPSISEVSSNQKKFLTDCLFENPEDNCEAGLNPGWVLVMYRDKEEMETNEEELKVLSQFLLKNLIVKVICSEEQHFCSKFESNSRFPRLNTLKYVNIASYEKYHGRFNAIDILNFALDSFESRLRVLRPEEFEKDIVSDSDGAHLVQFFSPRCPACKVAQQMLRKLSQHRFSRRVTFGVIDCGIYGNLCRRFNIQSYPTVLLYNNTEPHQYVGKFVSDAPLIDFIQYTLESKMLEITPEYFDVHIKNQENRPFLWVVSFSSPSCYICQVLAPTLRKLSGVFSNDEPDDVRIGSVNCNKHRQFCELHQIQSYPTIQLFPSSSDEHHKNAHYTFKNRRDFHMLRSWVYDFLPTSRVYEIEDSENFHQTIGTNMERPTLVDFYSPWAYSSRRFLAEFVRYSKNFTKFNFCRVNCDKMATLCEDLEVRVYPTLRFFSSNAVTSTRSMGVRIQLPDMDGDATELDRFLQKTLASLVEEEENLSRIEEMHSQSLKTEL